MKFMPQMNQYGSIASQASVYSGPVSKQQLRMYFYMKDFFLKTQIHDALVRKRLFYVFVNFDICFTTFLWIISLMLEGKKSLLSMLESEVLQYSFQKSLFDVLVLAYIRGTMLLLTDITSKQMKLLIFMSPFLTSLFLCCKVFYYEKLYDNSFVAALFIQSFAFTWIELFIFDYRIFQNIRGLLKKDNIKPEKQPLLFDRGEVDSINVSFRGVSRASSFSNQSGYYSPYEDSDMDDVDSTSMAKSLKAEDLAYLKKGQEVLLTALEIIYSDGWTKENKNSNGDVVESKVVVKGMKVFRAQAIIDATVDRLMKVLFDDLEKQPTWNKNLLEGKIIKKFDENTDIAYTLSAGKGPISSRDFVVLRHRAAVGRSLVITSVSIETDLVPVIKQYVRGEHGPGCFVITPLSEDASKCEIQWLMNTNLKGWLPQKAVDSAFTSVMLNFIEALREFSTQSHVSYNLPDCVFSDAENSKSFVKPESESLISILDINQKTSEAGPSSVLKSSK